MIRPATDGANAVEPGISLRSVHFLTVPGGQMQCCLQLMDRSSRGLKQQLETGDDDIPEPEDVLLLSDIGYKHQPFDKEGNRQINSVFFASL